MATDHIGLQRDFASYLREPERLTPPAGLSERRLRIYEELFFNNVRGFLDATFPVCAEILGEGDWVTLAKRFWAEHRCHSPYFLEIPQEFLHWLGKDTHGLPLPDYFMELAHYEWMELSVDVAVVPEVFVEQGNLIDQIPVLAPAAEGFLYNYPVQAISAEAPEVEAQQTALIVYRDEEESVQFIQTNPFTLGLLPILKEQRMVGAEAVASLLKSQGMEINEQMLGFGLGILHQWREQGLIRGTRRLPDDSSE